MAVSSEDGIDRDSNDYRKGYTEALSAVLQRLNNKTLTTQRDSLKIPGLLEAREIVYTLHRVFKVPGDEPLKESSKPPLTGEPVEL